MKSFSSFVSVAGMTGGPGEQAGVWWCLLGVSRLAGLAWGWEGRAFMNLSFRGVFSWSSIMAALPLIHFLMMKT